MLVNDNNNFIEVKNDLRYLVISIYALSMVIFGFIVDRPKKIIQGLVDIIMSPDLLITDYIAVGGIGAAFVNAGLLTLITLFILHLLKINITGISISAIFLIAGFALFGKNIFNIWLIIIGVYLYSKVQKDKFSKYIYMALFGTCMAPTITEFLFVINQPLWIRIPLSIIIGLGIGFILPPLAAHFVKVHQGYNLYNTGFTAGVIGTVFVSLLRSYGFVIRSNLQWSSGNNLVIGIYLAIVFISFIVTGYIMNGKTFHKTTKIFQYSGKLVSDFVVMEGFGRTLINMGINGFVALAYILIVRGPLNGPTVGGILTIVGFGAFGKHIKNMTPIFMGVILGSITKVWNINDPSILLAALFGTSLAPIAGQFGWKYGVIAGFINSSVVLSVGVLHGGLNLYNTGFSAGFVAAVMIPLIEAFGKEEEQ